MDNNSGGLEQKANEALESVLPKEKRDAIGRDKKLLDTGFAVIGVLALLGVFNVESFKPPTLDSVLKAAAPMVVVVAIFYVFVHGKLRKGEGIPIGYYGIGALMLYGAAVVGNALGAALPTTVLGGLKSVETVGPRGGTPPAMLLSMLGDFSSAYGIVLFVSALGVGVLVGRAWVTLTAD